MQALEKLLGSSKWLVTVAAILATAGVTIWGPLTADQFVAALKWFVGVGVGARALPEIGKAVGDAIAKKNGG